VTVNYARVTGLCRRNGRIAGATVVDRESGRTLEVDARLVINAAGPWLDRVGALSDGWLPRLRPTRGSHLLVPRLAGGEEALYLSAGSDERMFFVIPWGGLSLIGTTDLDDRNPPEEAAASAEEISYLLGETARYLPDTRLTGGDVISTFAGIRPLLAGRAGQASSVSREHAIFETPEGLLSMGGGKYTTFRAMAAELADLVMTRLGQSCGQTMTGRLPLPGGTPDWEQSFREPPAPARRQGLDTVTLRRLVDRYGARTPHLLELLAREPALAAPIVPGLDLLGVEVAYAADFEMARTPEDVLRRRTPLALRPGHGLAAVEEVAAILARRLGLSPQRLTDTITDYRHRYAI
jgi:glycerol-3-phosphate dehydrogenase